MQKITPFLWYDTQAEDAARFYTSTFKNSKMGSVTKYNDASAKASGMKPGSAMTVSFQIAGQKFTALNGGPVFKFTHANSFFVQCETENEIDMLWEKLSENSPKIFWPLKEYPFSKKYGWVTDKFGLSWQLNFTNSPQKIAPFLMFDGKQLGKAEEAINFYASIFDNSHIDNVMHYGPENKQCEGLVVHSAFKLSGLDFMAMDSGMPDNINFNESVSFVVNCDDQKELDNFWDKLSESGDPKAQMCGWLKDKYGVSWQIVPTKLGELLSSKEDGKSQRVMQKVLQMKKLDIAKLENA